MGKYVFNMQGIVKDLLKTVLDKAGGIQGSRSKGKTLQ